MSDGEEQEGRAGEGVLDECGVTAGEMVVVMKV